MNAPEGQPQAVPNSLSHCQSRLSSRRRTTDMSPVWKFLLPLVVWMVDGTMGGFPSMTPSVGEPWPRPQMAKRSSTYMIIRPGTFQFSTVGHNCDILEEALERYMGITLKSYSGKQSNQPWRKDEKFAGYLDVVSVNLLRECETYPHNNMDEHYEIKVNTEDAPGEGTIIGQSIWGILRGLETFSQLLVPDEAAFSVNTSHILDFPRFAFRGILLDTSRHYLPISKLKENLDLMAMNKFNVFHWHIVDDQSFPYESRLFPNLSKYGAYTDRLVYSAQDVANIVEYARLRGIRVLPEFDTPGHTRSWGPGQPNFLTPCYNGSEPDGQYGPVNPIHDPNYKFLKDFFTEVTKRFPDHYVHLGGDEVDYSCWKSNPNITEYMTQHNISGDYNQLMQVYITQLLNIIRNLPTKNGYLIWQEVFDNGVSIANDTVVHVWKNGPMTWKDELNQTTSAGYQTVLSSCWYLNYIRSGVDWYKYYECDPHDFNGTAAQKRLILGGEACMWGEWVDSTNVISRLWPRASVVAEKLWSASEHTTSTSEASPRLEEHRCRLRSRGYGVQPIWPSFCEADVA